MILSHKVLHKALHKVLHKNQKFIMSKRKPKQMAISETQEWDETTQSTQDSCYSWSGVSQEIDIKGEKKELSDNEEEAFKFQSTQKSTQETKLQDFKSSEPKTEVSSSQDDNKSYDEEEKNEDEKISF